MEYVTNERSHGCTKPSQQHMLMIIERLQDKINDAEPSLKLILATVQRNIEANEPLSRTQLRLLHAQLILECSEEFGELETSLFFSGLVSKEICCTRFSANNESIYQAVNNWCCNPFSAMLEYGHISTWNTSEVTSMKSLFEGKVNFNDDISMWDVSNVTDMSFMFFDAFSFNQHLNDWNVNNVKNMKSMFSNAIQFDQPLYKWNVGQVKDMSYMFNNASAFNEPLQAWNVSNVKYMRCMFCRASTFNQPLEAWNVRNVKNTWGMFSHAKQFNKPLNVWKLSYWSVLAHSMFYDAPNFQQSLDDWTVDKYNLYQLHCI